MDKWLPLVKSKNPLCLILTSSLFSQFSFLTFGFSTRVGGVGKEPFGMNLSFSVGDNENNVQHNRKVFFDSLQIVENKVAFTKQIHSNNISHVYESGKYENCDALITREQNLFLAITVADCVPIFLLDKKEKVVAAIHSGWRGCVNGILLRTLAEMENTFQTKGENILCYVGPCAEKCCYEVGNDVTEHFSEKYFTPNKRGKFFLDMKLFLNDMLQSFGVPQSQIEIENACTIHQQEIFHSYRRDGKNSGRMMGVIGMKN